MQPEEQNKDYPKKAMLCCFSLSKGRDLKKMENIKTIGQEDNLDRLWDRGIAILSYSMCFLSGFVLSGARLFSVHVPLSTGFAAACSGLAFPFAAAGAVIGGFLRLSGAELINALVPLAGTAGIKFFFEKTEFRPKGRYALSISVLLVSFFCGAVTMFTEEPSLYSLLLCICSSCLTAASVTFYSGTVECVLKKRSPYMLDDHALICTSVSLCSLLLGSSEISLAGFRPAGMFAAFVTLVASYLFGQTGGSISGVVMGAGSVVGGTGAALASGLGICGLLGGIFSKFGRFGCALVFSMTSGIISLIDGTSEGIAVFAQTAVAALIFVMIPGKRLAKVKGRIREPGVGRIRLEFSSAGERLKNAANAISSVSTCVSSVSQGINSMAPSTDILVCMRVRERVCSACRLKDSFCPENGDFEAITDKLSRGEEISAMDFSLEFNSKCPSVPRLADSFNRIYAGRKAINALQANSARNRELACGQFDWMAELLRELAIQTRDGATMLFGKEKTASRVLSESGFETVSVKCINPASGALKLECVVKNIPTGISLSRLTAELSREISAELLPPRIKEIKQNKQLDFFRKELFKVTVGSASASCSNQKFCGDYFESFRTENAAYIVLSDGMGTGGRAAVDSTMTVELFSRLIKAGLSPDTALNITNSALAVKSDDESVSTLDMARIDLFTGEAMLFKSGAAASYHTLSGRVRTVEIPSTPLGILSKASFSKYEFRLRGGDLLVMVSDGVLGSGNSWISDEIRSANGVCDPQTFAELILNTARHKCGEAYDDMTVIAVLTEEL